MIKNHLFDKGFTLIELMVVMSLISVLSSFLLSGVVYARDKSNDIAKIAEARQISIAAELYRQDNVSYLPTTNAGISFDSLVNNPAFGKYLPVLSQDFSSSVNRYISDGKSYEIALSLKRSKQGNMGCHVEDYNKIGSENAVCIGNNPDSSIWTGQSNEGVDNTPPSVPQNLNLAMSGSNSIYVSWDESNDFGGSGVSGYVVQQGNIQLPRTSSLFIIDSGLSYSTEYCYKVKSYDVNGNYSLFSGQVCITVPPSPPASQTATINIVTRLDGQVVNPGSCAMMIIASEYSNTGPCTSFTVPSGREYSYRAQWLYGKPAGASSNPPIITPTSHYVPSGDTAIFYFDFD